MSNSLSLILYIQAHLVKYRVLLSGLTPEMWTDQYNSDINQFINDSSQQILILYIDKHNGLTLCATLPTFPVEEIAYFIRNEDLVITAENFTTTVQFGTIQGNYVDGLLRSMHKLYGPTFFENQNWPDSIFDYISTPIEYYNIMYRTIVDTVEPLNKGHIGNQPFCPL